MDELQNAYLHNSDVVYFCESTADFTLEETARLVGKALGSAADADAAMIIINGVNGRPEFKAGEACDAQQGETPLSTIIRAWLEEQGTVSPGGNPWE